MSTANFCGPSKRWLVTCRLGVLMIIGKLCFIGCERTSATDQVTSLGNKNRASYLPSLPFFPRMGQTYLQGDGRKRELTEYIDKFFLRHLLNTRGIGLNRRRHARSMPLAEPWRALTGLEGFLESWFKNRTDGAMVWKWLHYFDVYERHFSKFRNADAVNLLEFGVNAGGSIALWRAFFGPGLHYYGVDINPDCRKFMSKNVTILIGDQTNRKSLTKIRRRVPDMDIIIDDGGHSDLMQTNTFEEMFQKLRPSGVYLCEDLGSSFHSKNIQDNKGYSMLDMAKDLVDKIYAWTFSVEHEEANHGFLWHRKNAPPVIPGSLVRRWPVDDFTRSADNMHVYRGIVVVVRSPQANMFPTGTTTYGSKIAHNIDVYNAHFSKFRFAARQIKILEIGAIKPDFIVGRLDLWREFFGPSLHYYAVSTDRAALDYEAKDATIFIFEGPSRTPEKMEHIRDLIPMLDIIIDVSCNTEFDQSNMFKNLFQKLQSDGVYLTEVNRADSQRQRCNVDQYSMLGLVKNLIDKSQAWLFPVDKVTVARGYVWDPTGLRRAYRGTSVRQWPVDEFVRTANNVHVYRGVVVVEKVLRSNEIPISVMAGKENIVCKSKSGCIGSSAKVKKIS